MAEYRLLTAFKSLFEGVKYEHRKSNLGDFVALHLYEDLVTVGKSPRYLQHVSDRSHVVNIQNRRKGISARRGDGTFGELIVGEDVLVETGYAVARGPLATVEIGVEVKILAKAMIKQIDRVKSDLLHQVEQFCHRAGTRHPICVGVVGVNFAAMTTSYEGERSYPTDGLKFKHPIQEAKQAASRLIAVSEKFDEFLILRYRARNEPPYLFEWVDEKETSQEYGATLIRISNEYQRRF